MSFEEYKKDSTIEKTISEIKKAEEKKEIVDAVEESEIEDVANAVIDEMPVQKEGIDDIEKMTGIELIIKELGINPDAQERKEAKEKLIKYVEKINEYGSDYINPYEYFEPSGAGDRSYDQEMNLFMEKRKDDKNYCPTFEYPGIDDLNLEKLDNDKKELIKLRKALELEKNESLKIICIDAIDNIENKIGLLESIKDKDYDQAFEYAIRSYGDINDELFNIAKQVYDKSITSEKAYGKHPFMGEIESGAIEGKDVSEEEQKKIDMREKLEEPEFTAEDYKNYFEILIKDAGFEKYGWEVIITSEKKILSVMGSSKDYDHPVVLVPEKYSKEKKSGLKIMKDLAHEFAHIITQTYNIENGFGGVSFGANYETYTEGLGTFAEKEIEEELVDLNIINKEKDKSEISVPSYYVLGIKKVKDGANFAELFDYLLKKLKKELRSKNESDIEEKAVRRVKMYCTRIFRGFDPNEGGKYFPKDKAYLEGEIGAIKMEEEELIDYLYRAKIDPVLVPYFIKLGTYTLDNKLKNIKKVVQEMLRNKKMIILDREYSDDIKK